jgi:hypothetical protein
MITIRKANDGQMTGCPVVAKAHMGQVSYSKYIYIYYS